MTIKKARRNADTYDPKTARDNNSNSSAGLYNGIFNKDISVAVFAGDGNAGERVIFRPLPPPDWNSPSDTFYPGRNLDAAGNLSEEPGDFSHWQRPARIVKFAGLKDDGCERFSAYIGQLRDAIWDSPYFLLYQRLKKASEGKFRDGNSSNWDPRWAALVNGKLPPIPSISDAFFLMAAVYRGFVYSSEAKKNVYTDFFAKGRQYAYGLQPGDPLPIVSLSGQTGRRLISGFVGSERTSPCDALLDKRKPDGTLYFPDPVGTWDPSTNTVTGGVMLSMYYPRQQDEEAYRRRVQERRVYHTTFNGQVGNIQGYEIDVAPRIVYPNNNILSPDLDENATKVAMANVNFWTPSQEGANDGLFNVISDEELAVKCVKAFKSYPQIFRFVWADRSDLLNSNDVRTVLANRTSSSGRVLDDTPADETYMDQPVDDYQDSYQNVPQRPQQQRPQQQRPQQQQATRRDASMPTRRSAPMQSEPVEEYYDDSPLQVADDTVEGDGIAQDEVFDDGPLPDDQLIDDLESGAAEEAYEVAEDVVEESAEEVTEEFAEEVTEEFAEEVVDEQPVSEEEFVDEQPVDEVVDEQPGEETDDQLFTENHNPVVESDPAMLDAQQKMARARAAVKQAGLRSEARVPANTVAAAPKPKVAAPQTVATKPKAAPTVKPAAAPAAKPAAPAAPARKPAAAPAAKPAAVPAAKPAARPAAQASPAAKPAPKPAAKPAPKPAAAATPKKPVKRT